ncbi:hypothetical protein KL930_004699 [Ogataea haglerorum]|uniref:Uncharacterized protein n=1 Tax=Ogataea haglerorum TaxID=1937702 RepID=A0AAN6D298_9ASCO|nr:hypothetical protein KL915_001639 [Ogataea haglerorum]KAG7710389.1 hypothetical protein KL914_001299 [Ogataea haglerorum]KAG7710830.1 hypothetical protein KL950_000796 [Ogataea haglerorum]KAG7725067.1 hypothetical protein KL933_004500 [Ogataea haglerorum]KAG7737261.1 hypothetical protein KL932_004221 [Ogataea haglerorum]
MSPCHSVVRLARFCHRAAGLRDLFIIFSLHSSCIYKVAPDHCVSTLLQRLLQLTQKLIWGRNPIECFEGDSNSEFPLFNLVLPSTLKRAMPRLPKAANVGTGYSSFWQVAYFLITKVAPRFALFDRDREERLSIIIMSPQPGLS